jgi:hypothetical protein
MSGQRAIYTQKHCPAGVETNTRRATVAASQGCGSHPDLLLRLGQQAFDSADLLNAEPAGGIGH